ncbi:MAG: permease [Candidatus Omnitrophica bacterium]|nr:permease [Candidatus Omnitrophota bacterium]MCB9720900.1 permease [Candidatus Omnitrophota bacterium]
MSHEHDCCQHKKQPWYRNKIFIVAVILAGLCALAGVVPALVPFRDNLMEYTRLIWIPMAIGLALGGVIDYYVPREYVSHVLASHQKTTVFRAVILGFFMSACSHGILALAIQLYKKGASTAAVIAFLLASPWANLPLTILLIGFFGVGGGVFIIMSALVIAVVTGVIFQVMESTGYIAHNENSSARDEKFSLAADFRQRFHNYHWTAAQLRRDIKGVWKGSVELGDMVLWWILIGIGIASLAGGYVPTEIFQKYMGPDLPGMGVTLAFATVIEVCSEGTAPVAFEIFNQTGAIGNSLVFLMAGVATDYTEIGLLWTNVGRKPAVLLPLITVPQILLWGAVANMLF